MKLRGRADRQSFFPRLISAPFHHGLVGVFGMAIAMSLLGAVASLSRGGRYVHDDATGPAEQVAETPVGASP